MWIGLLLNDLNYLDIVDFNGEFGLPEGGRLSLRQDL